ncbi:hypothetical protein HDU98_009140 [Podochytrium sp. JEL0797]|nr:hypothetical protein HDU98_009140 [Podochytrium sp. JEL0797]
MVEGTPRSVTDDDSTQQMELIVSRMHDLVPTLIASLDGEVTDDDARILANWADLACCKRFLIACSGKEEEATTRLNFTLQWRKDFKPDRILASEVEEEAKDGKLVLHGFDKLGRPIMFGIAKLWNKISLRFCVYMTEKAIASMKEGGEDKLALVMDNEGLGVTNGPSLSFMKAFFGTMEKHYPGRLGFSLLLSPSWVVSGVYRMIQGFLDPVVKSKIYFANVPKVSKTSKTAADASKNPTEVKELGVGGWTEISNWISADQLMVKFGGTSEFEFDRNYWEKLDAIVLVK